MQTIGSYQLIKSLGRGGMGEVFLAHDTLCNRHVALKKIREDLKEGKNIKERFLKEAVIASQLAHPNILPIYTIQTYGEIFYTMPYIEGETLKQIFRETRAQDKNGKITHPIGSSIPSLLQIFLNVCQAMSYCHASGILHRDLKPENIIIGKYGEVLIFDWGLSEYVEKVHLQKEESLTMIVEKDPELTMPGKVVGTLAYLAPERAEGAPSSIKTDIYALGVVLFQILTLRLPFLRENLKTFRKSCSKERLPDPMELAPYRDISPKLVEVVKKMLSPRLEERYNSLSDVIYELDTYIQGKPEWMLSQELHSEEKKDWEFQENILLASQIAFGGTSEMSQWVNLMISKASFPGNLKIETEVFIKPQGHGIGFLLNIPESSERKRLEEGYCLWIGSQGFPSSRLYRNNVEVMQISDCSLSAETWNKIRIEKAENHLRLYINDSLRVHYISHIPLKGAHIGLLVKDADFDIKKIRVFISTQTLTVSCLSVPDAFLASKMYEKALLEYRQVASSFSGRSESREALFRAGITLLEDALFRKKGSLKDQLLSSALEEFGKLRATPSAPIEYLGKSLVYKAIGDIEEELKCLELSIRKFSKHPLLEILHEQVVFRMHESASYDRITTYLFALLSLRHLPQIFQIDTNKKLLHSIYKSLPALSLFEKKEEQDLTFFSLALAFFLTKPIALLEMLENTKSNETETMTLLFCLLKMGYGKWVEETHFELSNDLSKWIEIALLSLKEPLKAIKKCLENTQNGFWREQTILFALEKAMEKSLHASVLELFPFDDKSLNPIQVECLLYVHKWDEAEKILSAYSHKKEENAQIQFLLGCLQGAKSGKQSAENYFLENMPSTLPSLFEKYLAKTLSSKWEKSTLFLERLDLWKKLALYTHCIKQKKESASYFRKIGQEYRKLQKMSG